MKSVPYPAYRPSGVEWLGDVPEHWDVRRLEHVASYRTSSVDKKAEEGEVAVRLCNYTDVYYQDRIRAGDGNFMEATASPREIARFGLRVGDVLVTKDSEDWQDIGVPALIEETASDFVCGYHLGIIRAHEELDSGFLFRLMQSGSVNQQLQTSASGVTRYGLPNSSVGDAALPIPPLTEQRAIAAFLDRETERIDTLVAKKRQLIERLQEYRTALITRTVTRGLPPEAASAAGLDPSPRLKPSGFEWLGDVPEHWAVAPLYTRYSVDLGKMLKEDRTRGDHLVSYLRNVDVQWDQINFDDLPQIDIGPAEFERYTVLPGDLLVCEGGEVGRAAIVPECDEPFAYQKALHRLRPKKAENPRFMFYMLRFAVAQGIFQAGGNPNTILHLTGEMLRRYRFPQPPHEEQAVIAAFLDHEMERLDGLASEVETAIERLQEYRTALITAAVTGKIDVRESATTSGGPAA
ncbi:MAG: restriction endonuclease subunit S [Dehalococcoidia bacterium]|nr:restriction endonuclease subunit S [Dehalococcoidia bacterium]